MNRDFSILRDLIHDQRYLVAAGVLARVEEEDEDFELLLGYLENYLKQDLSDDHWESIKEMIDWYEYLLPWTENELDQLQELWLMHPLEVADILADDEDSSNRLRLEAANLQEYIASARQRAEIFFEVTKEKVEPDLVPFFTYIEVAIEFGFDDELTFHESYEGEYESERDFIERSAYAELLDDEMSLDELEFQLFGNSWTNGSHTFKVSDDYRGMVFRTVY